MFGSLFGTVKNDLKMMVSAFLVAQAAGCLGMGCTTTKENNASNFVEWGTQIKWGQETSKTDAVATSTIDVKPLMDFIMEMREDGEGENDGE